MSTASRNRIVAARERSRAFPSSLPRSGRWLALLSLATVVVLGGCANRDMSDLREYAAEVRSRKGGKVPDIPQVESYEGFEYSAADLRSPFVNEASLRPNTAPVDQGPRPDPNRRKEYLESFPLDSLRMVGTLEIEGRNYALVRDADGLVHQVRPGQYLGQNYGRITDISEAAIEVRELILNGNGDGYIQREARVALN